jgi:hypothetical protein
MVRFLASGFSFGIPVDVDLGRRERDSGLVGVSWNHGLVGGSGVWYFSCPAAVILVGGRRIFFVKFVANS